MRCYRVPEVPFLPGLGMMRVLWWHPVLVSAPVKPAGSVTGSSTRSPLCWPITVSTPSSNLPTMRKDHNTALVSTVGQRVGHEFSSISRWRDLFVYMSEGFEPRAWRSPRIRAFSRIASEDHKRTLEYIHELTLFDALRA
jgi:hypothetical protein